ncbi:alpha-amylase [Chitinispirillum alkaliphilum]|nr:alpha-amylase [Chitinispirillum alkaliphilum]
MTGDNKKYVVIHGHFYQPPRENPWLDVIEKQESAAPYPNWNECIYDQCYRPNAYSRLLDNKGMISEIHNNYEKMSFNFGPTLFSWLERYHPVTLERIVLADKQSREEYDGHGNAVAQVFNHIIMPLASRRDQLTQIRWAKHHFRRSFKRDPEGIWLAETAINMQTVRCLIEENIKFVILSPNQAEKFRPMGDKNWSMVSQVGIDTRRPYRIFPKSDSGAQLEGYLDIFFFDEGLSKEISFNNLLTDANILGNRINSCYDNSADSQLVTIATDGETFGHHKAFGDMCLAYFFKHVAPQLGIQPVNFAYYRTIKPPEYEVSLKNSSGEGTAWSCAHGVGRWTRDCGCKTGGEDFWRQTWRKPLRDALNYLQNEIDLHYESVLSSIMDRPWDLRDAYVETMNEDSDKIFKAFIEDNFGSERLHEDKLREVRRLLEAQKYLLFSYTSCGWFFSDISGIETIQNMAYACRAIQLGLTEDKKESVLEKFLNMLEEAPSNIPNANGRTIFERHILPFFHHERLLAFAASVQQVIANEEKQTQYKSSYTIRTSSVKSISNDNARYEITSVELDNSMSGERSAWSVLLSYNDEDDLRGWIIPAECSVGSSNPDDWMSHEEAKSFSLHETFYTCREELFESFQSKMISDTYERFENWYSKNISHMQFLSKLDLNIPSYILAPMGFVFQNKWNSLIEELKIFGKEEEVFSQLLQLHNLIHRYDADVDFKQTAGILQQIIVDELVSLRDSLTAEKCNRLRCLLNVVDKFSVPVEKNKLEDIFSLFLSGPVTELYNYSVRQNPQDSDARKLLENVLSFANRMNFSTERFRL